MGENPSGSCPTDYPLSITKCTAFGYLPGCTVYGYPSSGGVLIKESDIVDMQFLSLDRLQPSERSTNIVEEDEFCILMRRLAATWWASEREWIDVQLGERERTELEKRVLIFGWPSDGVGVWMLRFASENELPKDFGRLGMVISMDEKVKVMREYGAPFYNNANDIKELL